MTASLLEPRHDALRIEAREKFRTLEPAADYEGDAAISSKVKALGYYGYLVPKQFGGVNERVDVRSICVLREEMAYRDAACDSLFAVQGLGSHPILLGGSDAQKNEYLPKVARGEALFAFGLTEPEAGSDVAALQTRAVRTANGYALTGHKRFISNAGVATHYTVFARTGEGAKGISAFVVPANTKGLTVKAGMAMLGDHPIGELSFENAEVPESARLGAEGTGMKLALSTLDIFRSTVGAAAIGLATRAQDEAISYAKRRKQFGAPLAELPAVQALIADSAVDLDASRLLVHRAAATKDGGAERVTYEAAVAKMFATEAAQRVIDRSLQIHGGNGVVKGFAVERLYRDVRALRIYEGATEVQRLVIARTLLKD